MTNKTITLHHCRVQVVEVTEGATDLKVFKFQDKYWHFNYKLSEWETVGMGFLYKDFGGKAKYPKSLQLIGVWPEITEEQAGMVVDSWDSVYKDGTKIYQHYPDEIPKCRTALKSLRSLLTANNIDPNKRWAVLIDKNKE